MMRMTIKRKVADVEKDLRDLVNDGGEAVHETEELAQLGEAEDHAEYNQYPLQLGLLSESL